MEVFRCWCGRGFDLDMKDKEKTFECPGCNTMWKAESKTGYYRLSQWMD
jgi:hypothetical protein